VAAIVSSGIDVTRCIALEFVAWSLDRPSHARVLMGYQWRHLLPNKNPTKPLIDLVGRLALLRN
ncbi:MAG: hypothetical protein VXW10_06780, partial [Pseudomonadota bacterium]|nr:hypothetical protein [Pseudomonadota bacterium]